ncbi:MAG: hypothetical protein WCO10_01995 [bacterium]
MLFCKKPAVYSLIFFAGLALVLAFPAKTFATTYATDGILTSTNLLTATTTSMINSVTYSASSIPVGTGLKIQFSYSSPSDYAYTWYDAEGLQDSWTDLSAGTSTIDLSGLGWNQRYFSYRVWFISDGSATPVLDFVNLSSSVGTTSYPTGGSMTSVNLLPANSTSLIKNVSYVVSSLPASTSLKIQFSYDGANWYNSAGVRSGRDNLSIGTNTIDLSGLGWSKANFFYRVWFLSDGSATPVLDSVTLAYDLLGGIQENSYATIGILTSANLFSGGDPLMVNSVSYNASAIPTGTSLKMQFSYDGDYWYSSAGVLNASTTLSVGTNTINLSALNWNKSYFFYRVWFVSNGSATPVLDSVSVSAASANVINGVYEQNGSLTSNDLLPAGGVSTINSFSYNVSSIPANTGIKVQFSSDGNNWYGSSGVLNASNTLSVGTSTIDLSGLGWNVSHFYYKAIFTSDGTSTPILDSASVNYSTGSAVVPNITVGKYGYQLATTTIPVSDQELGGVFTFVTGSGTATVTSVTLTQLGTVSTTSISNIKLYATSTDGTCASRKPSGTVLFGTASGFVGSRATTTGLLPVTASTTCVYATYNLNGNYSDSLLGNTIDFMIDNPSNDVLATSGARVITTDTQNINGATMIVSTSTDPETEIKALISIRTKDPTKNPTVIYLKNMVVYEKAGNGPIHALTNPNLKVLNLIFQDLANPSFSNGLVRTTITISNMLPGYSTTFLNVTRSMTGTASVRQWRGSRGR